MTECREAADVEPRLDTWLSALERQLRDPKEVEARRLVERLGLALQGSLLVRYGDPAVADAFCASRLDGDRGLAFGTLPADTDFGAVIDRHLPQG